MNYLENYYTNYDEEGSLPANMVKWNLRTCKGTALDLSRFEDESFTIL